jgi:hypothetical protein
MFNFNKELERKRLEGVKNFIKDAENLAKAINDYADRIEKSECIFVRNFGGSSKVIYKGREIIVLNRYIFGNYMMLKEGEKVFVNNKASSVFNNL